jgi:hypothetical protein
VNFFIDDEQLGSDQIKAYISVADGEMFSTAPVSWACVCRGPWDPCLRLINWVVDKLYPSWFRSRTIACAWKVPCLRGFCWSDVWNNDVINYPPQEYPSTERHCTKYSEKLLGFSPE